MKECFINFSSFNIDQKTVPAIMGVFSDKVTKGYEKVTFLFSSPGGNVRDGVTLYNFLKGLPIELDMFNIGNIDSIANVIFMAGKNRFAVPTSGFFFHDVGVSVNGNNRFNENNITETLNIIRRDRSQIIDIMTKESSIPRERLDELFIHGDCLKSTDALTYSIVQKVEELKIPKGVELLSFNFQ